MSWLVRRGEIRRARERGIMSERGGGRSHTFQRRMERVSCVVVGWEAGGGGRTGGIWSLLRMTIAEMAKDSSRFGKVSIRAEF